MKITDQSIKELVALVLDECIALRRELHRDPALSGEEGPTVRRVSRFLSGHGIDHEIGIGGNGIVATIGTGKEPAVGIRADIDALPVIEQTGLPYASCNAGVMHACGHDMHTAILAGVGVVLKRIEPMLKGTVKLFFQPMEETTGGAKPMIADGCMDDPKVSHVISLHVYPTLPVGYVEFLPGAMNAAVTDLAINVHGKQCHGAHPDAGTDAIVAASLIVTALQSIVSRSIAPTSAGVVTIGTFNAGSAPNVIAGEAVLTGTIRALDSAVMGLLMKRVKTVAEAVAKSCGAEAVVTLREGYPVLVNDSDTTERMMAVARCALGKERVLDMPAPSLGADDFAFFTKAAPSCYFNIGCTTQGVENPAPLHSDRFNPDEGCISVGILLETLGVLELLGGHLCS